MTVIWRRRIGAGAIIIPQYPGSNHEKKEWTRPVSNQTVIWDAMTLMRRHRGFSVHTQVLYHTHINHWQCMAHHSVIYPKIDGTGGLGSFMYLICSSLIPQSSSVLSGSAAVWWSMNACLLEHCFLGVHLNVNNIGYRAVNLLVGFYGNSTATMAP